jgi:hypothetical protein
MQNPFGSPRRGGRPPLHPRAGAGARRSSSVKSANGNFGFMTASQKAAWRAKRDKHWEDVRKSRRKRGAVGGRRTQRRS